MTHRSLRSRRRNADVPQPPETPAATHDLMERRPASSGRHAGIPAPRTPDSTWRPPVADNAVPRTGDAPTRVMRALTAAEAEAGLRDGFTQIMPVVDPAAPLLPKSATHSSFMPITELLPAVQTARSVSPEVEECRRRVVTPRPEPGLRNPAMRTAVRLFRAAQWLSRERDRRLDVMAAQMDAWDARIAEFHERWKHDDAHWDMVRAQLDGTAAGRAAMSLEDAYAQGGTELVQDMVPALARMIAEKALAGSGATR